MLICMNAWRLTLYMMITFYPFEDACFNAWNSLIEYEFLIWIKMHVWIHKIWFFVLFEKNKKCIYVCMKTWLNMSFWFEWKCVFECMKLDFLFFLKSAFMNEWNFVDFLNENACLNAWILFVFLIFFIFFKNAFMNAWNLFIYFFILNENACLDAWNFA